MVDTIAAREEKAEALKVVLPAFRGISLPMSQLDDYPDEPIYEEATRDLADYLEETFTDQQKRRIALGQDAFVVVGMRLKEVVEQLQGGTWVAPPEETK